jgi:tetratricopeptide (TPR) repeat protein
LRKEVSDLIESVLRDFPEDVYLTRVAVRFYQQCGSPLKVMALLEAGLKCHPDNFDLNNTAAKIEFKNGHYEKAILFGQKALAINAKKPDVHEDLAEAMLFSGQYQQAVQCLDNKVALLGGSERSYWLLGRGHLFLENYEKAKDFFEMAYQKNPHSAIDYYSNMAKLYMRLKQPEKAKEYRKLHSEMTTQQKGQELEDAKNIKERVVYDSSDSDVVLFSKALIRLCVQAGVLYLNKQEPEEAKTLFNNSQDIFRKSITIAPENADLYREFADLYLTTGKNLSAALPLAQKGAALEGSAANFFVLGQAYYKNSNLEKALWAYEQALKLEPKNMAILKAYNSILQMRF